MEHTLVLEHLSLGEAAEVLAGMAGRLTDGSLAVEDAEYRVSGPVQMAVDLDASHTAARVTISLQCRRPDGASRLLQEELARPGG